MRRNVAVAIGLFALPNTQPASPVRTAIAMAAAMLGMAMVDAQAHAQTVPTIIFESGLGDDAGPWRKTISALGPGIPHFSYDRPGYGRTPAVKSPRDPCTIATELHERLMAASVVPPYVLVGHSIGGQYAYAFARLFPGEMAGLVLVDATPIGHWRAMKDKIPAAVGMVKTMRLLAFSPTMRREFDAQEKCLADLPQTPMEFPVRVLVRTQGDPIGGATLLQIDNELAQDWLTRTGASKLEPVDGSGHYIQRERPAALADAIRDVAQAR